MIDPVRPNQIHGNAWLRYLNANLESYHIDEDDLQKDVIRVAKKSVKEGIFNFPDGGLEYPCGEKDNRHQGDILLLRNTENENHLYVIETKIINKPNYKPLYDKSTTYINRRKKVKEQALNYSEIVYNHMKKRFGENFWDNPKNKLYGITLTDEGMYVETVVNVTYYKNVESGVTIFE